MNITCDIEELLNILTYNKLFEYVDLPVSMASSFKATDTNNVYCHVEESQHDIWRIWYPVIGWINEQKRRSNLEKTLQSHRDSVKSIIVDSAVQVPREILQQRVYEAITKGDLETVTKLMNELNKL